MVKKVVTDIQAAIDHVFASTATPGCARATVIVPHDFRTIQEAIDALVIG